MSKGSEQIHKFRTYVESMIPNDAYGSEGGRADYDLADPLHAPINRVTFEYNDEMAGDSSGKVEHITSHRIYLHTYSRDIYNVAIYNDDSIIEQGSEGVIIGEDNPEAASRVVDAMRQLNTLGKLVRKT